MDYMVNLEQFYGPLDLLLYLVEKNEMNIYDISIALITDQYMDYIAGSANIDLDQLGDFLVMASYLLNLKSQILLPGASESAEEADEDLDPRQDLIHKLLEYKRYKKAAELLSLRLTDEYPRIFFRYGQVDLPDPEVEITAHAKTLYTAYIRLLENKLIEAKYQLPQGDVNVASKMDEILQRLQNGRILSFHDLYTDAMQRREILASFLALLELIRLNKVEARQEKRFGEIKLCASGTGHIRPGLV